MYRTTRLTARRQYRLHSYPIPGGKCQIYSYNLWEHATTDTVSQEEKMDFFATFLRFQTYLKLVGTTWNSTKMRVDAIVAYKILMRDE